ncbi:MAG TPA: DUF5658 family protein [Blastocatellia bacterium]|nr:DUF5658 family protein [Blastocatellia bacterium]
MVREGVLFRDSRLFLYTLTALAMSGYDAVATMQHIGRGVAAEGNPLMESLIQRNAVVFFLVKMAITAVCLMLCYSFSHLKSARLGIRMAVGIYSVVCVYHVAIVMLAG